MFFIGYIIEDKFIRKDFDHSNWLRTNTIFMETRIYI